MLLINLGWRCRAAVRAMASMAVRLRDAWTQTCSRPRASEDDMVQKAEDEEGYIPNCLYSFPASSLLRTSVHQFANFLIAYFNDGLYKDRRMFQEDSI